MAEVLEFCVPGGNERTLLVLGLETDVSEHALYLAFSAFGPLYSVKVHKNAPVAGPGYYALVKFYSTRDASRAQCACNQQCLFQKSPLKVCICTRQRPFPQRPLSLNKCQELASHYLGFNGWSSRLITLQNISGFEEERNEEEEVVTLPRSQCLKYLCIQELSIPQHGICIKGVGVAEPHGDTSQEFLMTAYRVQKLAAQRALSDAFQKILFVVLGKQQLRVGDFFLECDVRKKENGKVAVEYSSAQKDPLDCLTEEELKGLIQVTDLSLSQLDPEGKEESLSGISMDGEEQLVSMH